MLSDIDAFMVAAHLPRDLVCDHVCYRVETYARYDELKSYWAARGELVIESPIAGRPICIFRLLTPFQLHGYDVSCVELPAPKEGSPYSEGWEHAEFVIKGSFADFMAAHPHLSFDTADMGKASNPDISLRVNERVRIKFHHNHILDVVAREREAAR